MHGGLRVVPLDPHGLPSEPSSAYYEHGSLAYGCDWVSLDGSSGDCVVSCSFYDRAVHVWSVP